MRAVIDSRNVRDVHILVHLRDIRVQMLADGREFAPVDANHSELVDLGEHL